MQTAFLALPQRIEEDGLITFVEQLLGCDDADEIVMDAVAADAYTAGAVAALAAMRRRWECRPRTSESEAREVKLLNFERWSMHQCFEGCPIARGAFGEGSTLGLTSAICEVRPETGEVERVASELAKVVAPDGWAGGPLYPVVQYCFGELLRNCVQHTGGRAFAVVQEHCDALGAVNFLRLAVADCGRGVRLSFLDNESPKAHPGMSDADAINRAIQPFVSSTVHLPHLPYGRSSNMGVGLSMVRQLVRATAGHFAIVSGSAWLQQVGDASPASGSSSAEWPGCIVSLSLGMEAMTSYGEMLGAARDAIGLTPRRDVNKLFM